MCGIAKKYETLALEGANVYWQGTSEGTVTDQSGNFNISMSDKTNKLIKDSNLKIIPDMRHLIEPPVFIQFKDDLLNHLTS